MTFADIAARRERVRISRKDLCKRAGIAETTYSRLQAKPTGGRVDTLAKLSAALDGVEQELAAALSRVGA